MNNNVDVIIPTVTGGAPLEASVASALGQSFPPTKVIVVVNTSPDRGAAVPDDHRITVVYESRRGVGRARNKGLMEVTSPFVAFLDDDDVWMPFHLDMAMSVMELAGENGVVYAASGCVVPNAGRPHLTHPLLYDNRRFARAIFRNRITTSGVVMSAGLAKDLQFPTTLLRNEDALMWARAFRSGADYVGASLPSVFYFHRPWNIGLRRPLMADLQTWKLVRTEDDLSRVELAQLALEIVRRWALVLVRTRGRFHTLQRAAAANATEFPRDQISTAMYRLQSP